MSAQKGRIFVTGANGYVGSVVTEFAIAQGYQVHGLSRSEEGDALLKELGAIPVRGDLQTYDVLRRESAQAEIVLHLADAFTSDFGVDYAEVVRIHNATVDAMAEGLKDSDRPLVVASGSLVVGPDPSGAETTESGPL